MMNYKFKFSNLILFLMLISIITSCSQEMAPQRAISSDNISQDDNTPTQDETLPEITYLQQGTITSTTSLSLFSDFQDSFLLRGKNISSYLASLADPFGKTYCFIASYPSALDNKVLLLTARVKSYLNYSTQKNEFYFQMEAQNAASSTQHCLTTSVLSYINTKYATSAIGMSLESLCPSCTSNKVSQNLEIITNTAENITQLTVSHLSIGINFQASSGTEPINSCNSNVTCNAQGYNCCLAGQCVNHAAVRPGVDQYGQEFLNAQAAIANNPALIINYQDIFYVCPTMVSTNPENNPDPEEDPEETAANLLTKLRHLYQCLNSVQDEFSICTLKFENASEIMNGSGIFSSPELKDDLTIAPYHSITEIEYAGLTYYKQKLFASDNEVVANPSYISFSSAGPSNIFSSSALTHFQTVTAHIPIPSNAINDTLYLRYKVDGSCKKLGTSLAKCKKTYVQGQNSSPTRPSDHSEGSSYFALPAYANITNFAVSVSLGGVTLSEGVDTWQKSGQGIQFFQPVYNNQTVEITYFVSGQALVESLTKSKELAQAEVNTLCACEEDCNLKPVYSETDSTQIINYECKYPGNDDGGPLQKVIYLSSKTVPHRFYDSAGIYYPYGEIPENSVQEGKPFKYKSSNGLRPDYDDGTDIGFNEIYGSFSKDAKAPMPSTVVSLEKGKTYEIFTEQGAFSSCLDCGTDPYSAMVKLFPQNFKHKGAGYFPDMVEARRKENQSKMPADDMLFGRACFVPATMIPWTHVANADVTTQRRNRLKAQHFLFANGYNRDWYGFDYGAVIGSFDGVKWFAIGNQRKVVAKTNRLFLAINAYFGDVTIDNNFTIMVNESASVINSGSGVTHDLDSDGAQCQQAHLCNTDRDCFATLGADYSCQNVTSLRTSWPQFDTLGNEISGSLDTTLISLVGGTNGEAKRCVYRGRGSLCQPNAHHVSESNSYSKSTGPGVHMCSGNNYCESINSDRFNERIARYASSVNNQNASTYVSDKTDTFGLAARIMGRPYDFFGTKSVPNDIKTQLLSNQATHMCIPGKETISLGTTEDLNSRRPANRRADKMFNIGITQTGIFQSPLYYAACSAVDSDGTYTYNRDLNINSDIHKAYTISQNVSSNLLDMPFLEDLNIFNDSGERITTLGLNYGTCLKTAGSPCFTDLDCGPSNFIANKVASVSDLLSHFNEAEANFWKEGLVCRNNQERYLPNSTYPNPIYDITTQRCCRETRKKFTYYTATHEDPSIKVIDNSGNPLVPGVNQSINDPAKYTSNQIIYDKLLLEPTKYPPLYGATPRPNSPITGIQGFLRQYNTLQEHNSRMCCSNHWVRSFASGSYGNGGGHTFTEGKKQNFEVEMFQPLNWLPIIDKSASLSEYYGSGPNHYISIADIMPFTCTFDNMDTAACEMKNIIKGSNEEQAWLDYFGRFELLGIPQILIPTNNSYDNRIPAKYSFTRLVDDQQNDLSDLVTPKTRDPLPGTVIPEQGSILSPGSPAGTGIVDVVEGSGPTQKRYYSAASYDNFDLTKLKRVFSENEFNCCLPTGYELPESAQSSDCCTGLAWQPQDAASPRCCLPNFVDLSVYTNAYVSSEGYNNLNVNITESDIDPETGYIKKGKVMQMAQTMCCSGKGAPGTAIQELYIPVGGNDYFPDKMRRRWVDNSGIDNDGSVNGAYLRSHEKGVRWNNHIYCVPSDWDGGSGGGGSTTGGASQQ